MGGDRSARLFQCAKSLLVQATEKGKMRLSARQALRKLRRYRFEGGGGTSVRAVLRRKRSSKNLCAVMCLRTSVTSTRDIRLTKARANHLVCKAPTPLI
jgi:hypothetical protein